MILGQVDVNKVSSPDQPAYSLPGRSLLVSADSKFDCYHFSRMAEEQVTTVEGFANVGPIIRDLYRSPVFDLRALFHSGQETTVEELEERLLQEYYVQERADSGVKDYQRSLPAYGYLELKQFVKFIIDHGCLEYVLNDVALSDAFCPRIVAADGRGSVYLATCLVSSQNIFYFFIPSFFELYVSNHLYFCSKYVSRSIFPAVQR